MTTGGGPTASQTSFGTGQAAFIPVVAPLIWAPIVAVQWLR